MGYYGLNEPHVRKVLNIAEEIMHSGKTLDVDHLCNVTKRELKLSGRKTLEIIDFLLGNHILIEGTRFSRDEILENTYRAQIWRLIKTFGGVHFSFIKKQVFFELSDTPGSPGQLLWHLGLLLRFKYVKRCKAKNYTIFMPATMDEEMGIVCFLLNDTRNLKIMNLLIQQPIIRKADIYDDTVEDRDAVRYRINNLKDFGLIEINKINQNELQLREDKRDIVVKALKYKENAGE